MMVVILSMHEWIDDLCDQTAGFGGTHSDISAAASSSLRKHHQLVPHAEAADTSESALAPGHTRAARTYVPLALIQIRHIFGDPVHVHVVEVDVACRMNKEGGSSRRGCVN